MTKMDDKVLAVLKKLEQYQIYKVDLLALVTDTSYEVTFFGYFNNKYEQSNILAEQGVIPFDALEAFYADIAKLVRSLPKYDAGKLNILKVDEGEVSFRQKDRSSDTFTIVNRWERSLGI